MYYSDWIVVWCPLFSISPGPDSLFKGNGKCDVLLAHDWGAGIGWELVIRHPDLVRRFVPMNCPHPAAFISVVSSEPSQIIKSWSVKNKQQVNLVFILIEVLYIYKVHDILSASWRPRKDTHGFRSISLPLGVPASGIEGTRRQGLSRSLSESK